MNDIRIVVQLERIDDLDEAHPLRHVDAEVYSTISFVMSAESSARNDSMSSESIMSATASGVNVTVFPTRYNRATAIGRPASIRETRSR